jgi:hypothetical protein
LSDSNWTRRREEAGQETHRKGRWERWEHEDVASKGVSTNEPILRARSKTTTRRSWERIEESKRRSAANATGIEETKRRRDEETKRRRADVTRRRGWRPTASAPTAASAAGARPQTGSRPFGLPTPMHRSTRVGLTSSIPVQPNAAPRLKRVSFHET